MKKVNLKNKLALNKESIAKLNDNQMNKVVGGAQTQVGCPPPSGSAWKCCRVTEGCPSTMC